MQIESSLLKWTSKMNENDMTIKILYNMLE